MIIIFCLFVLFFTTSDSLNSGKEKAKSDGLNASNTSTPESLAENTTSPYEGQFNSTNNETSGPVAITLEKPPFIN